MSDAEVREHRRRLEVLVVHGLAAQLEQRDVDPDEHEQQQQDGRVGERREVAEDDQHGGDEAVKVIATHGVRRPRWTLPSTSGTTFSRAMPYIRRLAITG